MAGRPQTPNTRPPLGSLVTARKAGLDRALTKPCVECSYFDKRELKSGQIQYFACACSLGICLPCVEDRGMTELAEEGEMVCWACEAQGKTRFLIKWSLLSADAAEVVAAASKDSDPASAEGDDEGKRRLAELAELADTDDKEGKELTDLKSAGRGSTMGSAATNSTASFSTASHLRRVSRTSTAMRRGGWLSSCSRRSVRLT